MPYFSIIVPIYNVEKYLKKCIESILIQDFSDYEIILVDDGSTDESGKICDSYKEIDNISVIHKENSGLAAARNTGIKNARGEWCVFVDSDDYIGDSNFLSKLYKYSSEQDMIIYGCSQFIDGTEKVVRYKYKNIKKINKLSDTYEKLKYLNTTNNVSISAWTHAIRKGFIIKSDLMFDETIKVDEDIDWFFRIMLKNPRMAAINGSPYFYRIRQNSLSRMKKKGFWKYRFNAIKLSERYINNSDCDLSLKKELLCYLSYQYMILLKDAAEDKRTNDFEKYTQINDISYLLNYGRGIKNDLCKIAIKLFGVKKSSKIIAFIKK